MPAPPQWVNILMYCPVGIRGPFLPYSKPLDVGRPWGTSPTRGSPPTSLTQTNHRLHHNHIESTRHPPILPFSLQDTYHLYPIYLCLSQILLHRWIVVVGGWKNASQVIEWRYHQQRRPIWWEYLPHLLLHLRNNQPPSLTLQSAPTHSWDWLRLIECLLWGKNSTLGAQALLYGYLLDAPHNRIPISMIATITTLNIVGDRGYPWVTPWWLWKAGL